MYKSIKKYWFYQGEDVNEWSSMSESCKTNVTVSSYNDGLTMIVFWNLSQQIYTTQKYVNSFYEKFKVFDRVY